VPAKRVTWQGDVSLGIGGFGCRKVVGLGMQTSGILECGDLDILGEGRGRKIV
jgi:hypothetical protein